MCVPFCQFPKPLEDENYENFEKKVKLFLNLILPFNIMGDKLHYGVIRTVGF